MLDLPENTSWQLAPSGEKAVFIGESKNGPPKVLIRRDMLVQTGMHLQIKSDARTCTLSTDTSSLDLSLNPNVANEVVCKIGPDLPTISLNGSEMVAVQGKWIQIAQRSTSATVTLTLQGGTYASLQLGTPERSDAGALGQTGKVPTPPVSEKGIDAARSQMLERLQKGVFQIRVKDGARMVLKSGTGFLLSSDGFAATNFHVVQGAASAVGVFSDQKDAEVRLELWAVRPEFDLAIVRLDWGVKPPAKDSVIPLEIEKNLAQVGEDVCALGFPEMGYSVTRGIVSAIRKYSDLPAAVKRGTPYADDSLWIQTDCAINHGNSGGPLVNSQGHVVGINTWRWPDGNSLYFALSATHLGELLDKRSSPAITFAAAAKQYGAASLPHADFPRVQIVIDNADANVAGKAKALYSATLCPRCNGTGVVTYDVVTRVPVGIATVPQHSTRTETCPDCQGAKYRYNPVAAERLLPQLVESLARINPTGSKYQAEIDSAVPAIRQLSEVTPESFDNFGQACLRAVNGSGSKSKPGAPFVALGVNVIDFKMPGEGDHVRAVRIYQNYRMGARLIDRSTLVVLTQPRIVDAVKDEFVVVGGIFAGSVDGPGGEAIPVVQDGFIVGVGGASRYLQIK